MREETPTAKKLLTSFDPSNPKGRGGGFVVPIVENERVRFFDLQSNRFSEFAMMVFVGRPITANDLFAKLVDTGRHIPNVEEAMRMLSRYVICLSNHKVGNVVSIEPGDRNNDAFQLVKLADTPSAASRSIVSGDQD
ncbi:hypothetical protein [Botrimarina sp.]|uniref:hypothetical protein n=1 Tax=Botrimarina sp. TaxID=2795802 RepID=UPI0032EE08B5